MTVKGTGFTLILQVHFAYTQVKVDAVHKYK